jgi:thymidylate kinase
MVVDGSTVQERGAIQTSYRLHLGMDLLNLTLTDAVLTTDKVGEKRQHDQIQEGYVFVADRGYSRAQTIIPVIDQGADVIIRYTPNSMPLYSFDAAGQKVKIDWK